MPQRGLQEAPLTTDSERTSDIVSTADKMRSIRGRIIAGRMKNSALWATCLLLPVTLASASSRILQTGEQHQVSQHSAKGPELLLAVSGELPCQEHNAKLNAWLRRELAESDSHLVPSKATDLDSFVLEVKEALDANQLPDRPIHHLFSGNNEFHPTCAGEWLEFGVASGGTVNMAAHFRHSNCSPSCPSVFGFDTFTGLPEKWVRDDAHTWAEHDFDQGGKDGRYPAVEENVHLIKGLFNESIPPYLYNMGVYAGKESTISYLHVDCDLYAGTRDIFHLLGHKIKVGTVIVFDELINYQYFKDHEIKALWEWASATGTKFLPLGAKVSLMALVAGKQRKGSKRDLRYA